MSQEIKEVKEFLSNDFKESFLKLLMESRFHFDLFKSVLSPEHFDKGYSQIYKAISDVYKENPNLSHITFDLLSVALDKITPTQGIKLTAKRIYRLDIEDRKESILAIAREWIRNERMKKALEISAYLFKEGKIDKIKDVIEDAYLYGLDAIEYSDFDSFFKLDKEIEQIRGKDVLIRTGFPTLDKYLSGGMGAGEIYDLLGGAKAGKTTVAIQMGVNALKQRKSVVHITLELSEPFVKWKYACCITGKTYDEIRNDFESAKPLLNKFKEIYSDKLFIKKFPMKKTDCNTIKAFINALIDNGKIEKPDLIIIDYDDLLKPIKAVGKEYEDVGRVYEDMIDLANYFMCPILTPTQTNRTGWKKSQQGEMLTSAELSHSALKRMHTTAIITINYYSDTKGYFFIDTARIGKQNEIVDFDCDFLTCRFRDSKEQYDDLIDVDELDKKNEDNIYSYDEDELFE